MVNKLKRSRRPDNKGRQTKPKMEIKKMTSINVNYSSWMDTGPEGSEYRAHKREQAQELADSTGDMVELYDEAGIVMDWVDAQPYEDDDE